MAENTATATDTATKVSYKVVRIEKAALIELHNAKELSFGGGGVQNEAGNYPPNRSYKGRFLGYAVRESDKRVFVLLKGEFGSVRASFPQGAFKAVSAMEDGEICDFDVKGSVIDGVWRQWAELATQIAAKKPESVETPANETPE